MNWRLIFQLSLFGLAMGLATVFFVPSNIEPFFWLVIFIISAYLIATRTMGRFFLHGLMVGIGNSIWITAVHVALFRAYADRHAQEVAMSATMGLPTHPRLMMALTGPVIGVVSGIVIGLLALLASRLVKGRATPATVTPA
jgi:hypothetical protein